MIPSNQVVQAEEKTDTFCLSERGRNCLELDQTFGNPACFAKFRLHDPSIGKSDFGDLGPFEAMMELSRQGWTHEKRTGSQRVVPYKAGGKKCWYFNKTICKYYLKALLSSKKLMELGLQEIHHFPPTMYYRTLIYMMKFPGQLNNVKPRQNRAFYVLMQQNSKKRNAKSGGTKSAADGDMEDERGQGRTVPDHFDIFDVSYQMIGHYVDVHSGTHNTMHLYSFKFLVKSCKYT